MQPTLNTIEEILDAHLALMATDTEAWADLLAEDVIVEFPYAPALGRPGRLEGKAAAYNHIKSSLTQMQNLTFSNVRKYPTTDPNVLWAELHGSALVPTTGRRYEQDYVVRVQVKDGKTVQYSEYWNPLALIDNFGNTRNDPAESATTIGGVMRYQEKVVVITGSSAGIGAATARRLASEGALLVVNGRSADKLERFASELPQDRVLLHIGDVSEEANAKALITAAIDRFGQIDVLVNNASFFGFADLASQTVNDWRQTFATNVDAVFHMSQAALPYLVEGASIVNVSSVSALGGDMMMSAYNAAKGALTNYTRALAVELGLRGIRVNAVLPSIAWTERTAVLRDNSAIVAREIERMPLGRIAEAEEVAAAIAFLASQDASYVTGVNLPVDGGLTASSGLAPFV